MELGPTDALYASPLHPYTQALLAAVPIPDPLLQAQRLPLALPGEPPAASAPPGGCVFRTRCRHALAVCGAETPAGEAAGAERTVACHRWRELAAPPPLPA
jgi:peptide/nickel transport system ATP-binding protein